MPISTTLVTTSPSALSLRAKCMTWSTISSEVRLRFRPIVPVAQNAQAIGQPAWLETQTVLRSPSCRMRTVSISWPSAHLNAHFAVSPFEETDSLARVRQEIGASRSSFSRRAGGRAVASDHEETSERYFASRTWESLYLGSPSR